MLKTIRVDMETKRISTEEFDTNILFGGRGLMAKTLLEEVDPQCDPLSSKNKLVFATGLFAGYNFPTGNRLSAGAKSPLTGTIKESNVGGTAATNLIMHAIKEIIIENAPSDDRWYLLRIAANGNVSLESAHKYVSKGTYETTEMLKETHGGKLASICVIGPAGERMYKVASIQVTDGATGHPSRAAGRGGLGAVMGSKHLKAIIIDRPKKRAGLPITDEEKVKSIIKDLHKINKKLPQAKVRHEMGTYGNSSIMIPMNAYPLKNFSGKVMTSNQRKKFDIDAYLARMNSYGGKQGLGCQAGCPVKCSNKYYNEQGEIVTSGLEYETIALSGPNCDIYDWDYVAEYDRICDDLGIDTMDIANAIAVAMDAGYIPWGDIKAAKALLNDMKEGKGFGNILGNGTQAVGDYLKFDRVPTCKGQSMAAYDPRAFKGMGVTYSTATQGADHTAGPTMSVPDLDHSDPAPQPAVSKKMQLVFAMVDNVCCAVNGGIVLGPDTAGMLPELITAIYGVPVNADIMESIGIQTLKWELEFNRRAGIRDNRVPKFIREQKIEMTQQAFDVDQAELDNFWERI